MSVVLASASPRRRELLAALVPAFDVVAANIDEPLGADAVADAVNLAMEKAGLVAASRPGYVVIGADTVVFDALRAYGKPIDAADAASMLRALRGRDHSVVTGVAVISAGATKTDASIATVTMRPLSDRDIERYVATGVPLDKAGAYAIQHDELPVVAGLAGCYCNVMGLPLWRLKGLLERAGVQSGDPGATFERCGGCPDRPAVRDTQESL